MRLSVARMLRGVQSVIVLVRPWTGPLRVALEQPTTLQTTQNSFTSRIMRFVLVLGQPANPCTGSRACTCEARRVLDGLTARIGVGAARDRDSLGARANDQQRADRTTQQGTTPAAVAQRIRASLSPHLSVAMVSTRSNSRPRSTKKSEEGAASSSGSSSQRAASPARRRSVSRSRRASRAETTDNDGVQRVTRRRSSRAGIDTSAVAAVSVSGADGASTEEAQPSSPQPPAASAAAAMQRARRASHGDIAAVIRQAPRGYLTPLGLQTLKEYKYDSNATAAAAASPPLCDTEPHLRMCPDRSARLHRYQSGFTGATDKYVMIPLWNWCLQFVPIWMASVTRHGRGRHGAVLLDRPGRDGGEQCCAQG